MGIVVLVVATNAFTSQPTLHAVGLFLMSVGAREVVVAVFAIVLLSVAVNPMQTKMIKVLEGYWKPIGLRSLTMEVALRRQRDVRENLSRTAAIQASRSSWHRMLRLVAERWLGFPDVDAKSMRKRLADWYRSRYVRYPRLPAHGPDLTQSGEHADIPDRIMPTRLGNTLRYYEDLAGNRFGLDAIRFIPYLYGIADQKQVALISDARLGLDVAVRMVWSWLFVFVFSFAAFFDDGPWLIVPLCSYGLAWFSYVSSISSAESYGIAMVRILDLYRFDLLKELHWPLPDRPCDEVKNNQALEAVLQGDHSDRHGGTLFAHRP